jgi:hypothetical protein
MRRKRERRSKRGKDLDRMEDEKTLRRTAEEAGGIWQDGR